MKRRRQKACIIPKIFTDAEMPGFWTSIFAAVIPVVLMALAAVFELTTAKDNPIRQFFEFIGNPAGCPIYLGHYCGVHFRLA